MKIKFNSLIQEFELSKLLFFHCKLINEKKIQQLDYIFFIPFFTLQLPVIIYLVLIQFWFPLIFSFGSQRALARKLTYALAASFQEYSKRVKEIEQKELNNDSQAVKKKFAIDLRSPEEMQQTIDDQETEA